MISSAASFFDGQNSSVVETPVFRTKLAFAERMATTKMISECRFVAAVAAATRQGCRPQETMTWIHYSIWTRPGFNGYVH